jgi:hypothetical protein
MPDSRLRSPTRRPDPVTLAWIGGIVLAVLAYAVGPEHVVSVALDAVQRASWYADELVHRLSSATIAAMRAVAIGLYGTFVILSLMALRRGAPAIGSLVVITLLFLLLVWGAEGSGAGANLRWLIALALAALAALNATRRLGRG